MATCKLGEKGCWKDGKCHYIRDCENKVLTNADLIRSMSDEDLADFLAYTWAKSARAWQKHTGKTLHWLQQPAK